MPVRTRRDIAQMGRPSFFESTGGLLAGNFRTVSGGHNK